MILQIGAGHWTHDVVQTRAPAVPASDSREPLRARTRERRRLGVGPKRIEKSAAPRALMNEEAMTHRVRAVAAVSTLLVLAAMSLNAQEPAAPAPTVAPVRQGPGVVMPRIRKEVKPSYTAEAMRMQVTGSIGLETVVLADGTVGSVEVVACDLKSRLSDSKSAKNAKAREALLKSKFVAGSCTETFGLADVCMKTVKQWQFTPGRKDSVAVPVLVDIEMTFTLR